MSAVTPGPLHAPARSRPALRFTALLLALLFLPLATAAQDARGQTLSGRVLDQNGAAVRGASVTLTPAAGVSEVTATTDEDGAFRFEGLAPGRYAVLVGVESFAEAKLTLEVDGRAGRPVEIVLAPATLSEKVTVTAEAAERERLDAAVPQTGAGRAEFAARNNRRVGDVLQRLPGLYLTGPPGENKDVRLRGLDKEFTRTQVDGVQLPDGGEKRELQLDRLSSFLVEDVRVVRNATAEYESDGIAGRVAVQTRPIPESLTVEGRLGYGGRGSLDRGVFNGAVSFGFKPRSWFGLLGVFDQLNDYVGAPKSKLFASGRSEAEDELERRRSPNFFLDLGLFYGGGEFHLKPLLLKTSRDKDKTKLLRDPGRPATKEEERELTEQGMWGVGLSHRHATPAGLVWDTLAGYYRTSEEKDKTKLNFRGDAAGFALDKTTLEPEEKADETWNFSSSVALPFGSLTRHEMKLGVAARLRDRFRDKRRLEVDRAGRVRDTTEPKDAYALSENYYAAFVQDRLRLTERLALVPGLRVERVSLRAAAGGGAPAGRTLTDLNPSAHLLYRLRDDLSLRAAVSRGVNRPKFDELSPFEQETGRSFVVGNPGLDPARSWNYDFGGEYVTPRLFIGANFFQRNIRGVIEQVDTGLDRNGKDVLRVENVGDGWARGLELEQRLGLSLLGVGALRGVTLWANETILDSELTEAGGRSRPFKEQPRFISNVGLDYARERSGTTLSLAWNYVSTRDEFKPNGDLKSIRPASALDLALRQRLHRAASLFVEVDNLAGGDRREVETAAGAPFSRREERLGRTVLAGLSWRF
jgi:outer membrane receptor for ferrienterochelin and colicins